MIAHRHPNIERDHEVEARPVEMIAVSLVHEVGGLDAGDGFLAFGQCFVMEHERPKEFVV